MVQYNANHKFGGSAVVDVTELNYLNGARTLIQDQLDSGWVYFPTQPTYVSTSQIKFSGVDYTPYVKKGDKITFNNPDTRYFYVTAASFSTDTTLTLTGGSDYAVSNSAITACQFSHHNTPRNFPAQFNWTPGFTGFSVNPTVAYSKFSISGGAVHLFYKANGNGTSNATGFTITGLPVTILSDDDNTGARLFSGRDNSVDIAPIFGCIASTTMNILKTMANPASWTASGQKTIYAINIIYPI